MSSPALGKIQESLVEQGLAQVLTPAGLFWAAVAGLGIWLHGWDATWQASSQISGPGLVVVLFLVLVLILGSSALVRGLTLPALQFLEGYGPLRAGWLDRRLIRRTVRQRVFAALRFDHLQSRLGLTSEDGDEQLARKDWKYDLRATKELVRKSGSAADGLPLRRAQCPLIREEIEELARREAELTRISADPADVLPTRLGNVLRAMERQPARYGLDAILCWPRLWLLLPEVSHKEIAVARRSLDEAVVLWLWSLLLLLVGIAALAVTAVGAAVAILALLAMTVAYSLAVTRAGGYAELTVSAFDIYRRLLYEAMGWPLPKDPLDERTQGQLLTEALARGLDEPWPSFRWNAETKRS